MEHGETESRSILRLSRETNKTGIQSVPSHSSTKANLSKVSVIQKLALVVTRGRLLLDLASSPYVVELIKPLTILPQY